MLGRRNPRRSTRTSSPPLIQEHVELYRRKGYFLDNTFEMMNDKDNQAIVGFQSDGTTWEIRDMDRFCSELLPHYFRHTNYKSFIRQLNIYGFVCVHPRHRSAMKSFRHPYFRKNDPRALHYIVRHTGGGHETFTNESDDGQNMSIDEVDVDLNDEEDDDSESERFVIVNEGKKLDLPQPPHPPPKADLLLSPSSLQLLTTVLDKELQDYENDERTLHGDKGMHSLSNIFHSSSFMMVSSMSLSQMHLGSKKHLSLWEPEHFPADLDSHADFLLDDDEVSDDL